MSSRREAILREMGLGPIWRMRGLASATPRAQAVSDAPRGEQPALRARSSLDQAPDRPRIDQVRQLAEPRPPSTTLSPLPQSNRAATVAPGDGRRLAHIASLEWDALEDDIRGCTACRLCEGRQQAVPGIGDRSGAWMMVGEGPGAEEDRRGEPFVGPAGQLLDDMLAAIGLSRSHGVFIANAVKCRPPLNRTPQADEIAACLPYLERQISLVEPKLLVALGRPAAQSLLGGEIKINAARGRLFSHAGVPVVITYHPAYLLRNQSDKGRAWEDLCFARATMARLRESGAD